MLSDWNLIGLESLYKDSYVPLNDQNKDKLN
jgi:hypothetical protein